MNRIRDLLEQELQRKAKFEEEGAQLATNLRVYFFAFPLRPPFLIDASIMRRKCSGRDVGAAEALGEPQGTNVERQSRAGKPGTRKIHRGEAADRGQPPKAATGSVDLDVEAASTTHQ